MMQSMARKRQPKRKNDQAGTSSSGVDADDDLLETKKPKKPSQEIEEY